MQERHPSKAQYFGRETRIHLLTCESLASTQYQAACKKNHASHYSEIASYFDEVDTWSSTKLVARKRQSWWRPSSPIGRDASTP